MGKENSKPTQNEFSISSESVALHQVSPSRLVENFVLVWVDAELDVGREGTRRLQSQLQQVVHCVQIFTDLESCAQFLRTVTIEKIFLLLSGSSIAQAVWRFQENDQISSIFIFDQRMFDSRLLTEQCRKVKCTSDRMASICEMLQQEIEQVERQLTPMSILKIPTTIKLNELNPSFMYSQLLKEVLLDMHYVNSDRTALTQFCRLQYIGNETELKVIDEFERDYRLHTPIWWYTRECFLYLMLNRALRGQEIDTIIKMGFFIRDLHEQIHELYSRANSKRPLTVYRGQSLQDDSFERLKSSPHALLSFHSFLSTSTNRNVSLGFARRAVGDRPNVTGVLFRMEIDPAVSSAPYAMLDDTSCYSNTEHEVLFSMHTVFRIEDMTRLDEKLWEVNLTLTSDDDAQLNCLRTYVRHAIEQPTSLRRLAKLMLEMDELDKAEEIYTTILEMAESDHSQERSFLHNQLGFIAEKRHDLFTALAHYEKSLQLDLVSLPANHPDLSAAYSNIGEIYRQQGAFDAAIQNYEKAVQIETNCARPDYINLATFHNNLGMAYKQQENFSEALRHFERTLELELAHLPPLHANLARTYNNIAGVYYSMEDHPTALLYLEQTLEIQQKSLLPTHLLLAHLNSNIAYVLSALHRHEEAMPYARRALQIARHTLADDHPHVQNFESHLEQIQTVLHART